MIPRVLLAAVVITGCAGGPPAPAALQEGVACSHCRMTLVDGRLAAQIAAPGEDPRFFDDIGCLARDLAEHPLAPAARAYVADHFSGAWVPAAEAIYCRNANVQTPMGSHLIAYATDETRAKDPSAQGAERVDGGQILRGAAVER